jgi:hypothetical protein
METKILGSVTDQVREQAALEGQEGASLAGGMLSLGEAVNVYVIQNRMAVDTGEAQADYKEAKKLNPSVG